MRTRQASEKEHGSDGARERKRERGVLRQRAAREQITPTTHASKTNTLAALPLSCARCGRADNDDERDRGARERDRETEREQRKNKAATEREHEHELVMCAPGKISRPELFRSLGY